MEYSPSNNAYAAPEATLESSFRAGDEISAFPRFSTCWVLLLSIVTLSIYMFYWLYSRTRILNRLMPDSPISVWLYGPTIALVIANFVIGFLDGFYGSVVMLSLLSSLCGMLSTILLIVWVFSFRNRLNRLAGSGKSSACYAGPILTFFLGIWYMSYKINQLIDHRISA